MYYLLVDDLEERTRIIEELNARDVNAVFHYVPLHSSSAGTRFGRAVGELPVTREAADRLIRLPLWAGMSEGDVERTAAALDSLVRQRRGVASA
jgi:dTDP-4-amino-4,6-dideoxygalactose transaminase